MLKNKSNILNVFFMKDLTKLIEKYNNIDKDIVQKLEDLVAKVDDNEIKETLMNDLDATLVLVDELGEEVEDDVIKLYFFIKNHIKEINIIEAKTIYEEITFRGYSKLDDIIMYSKLKDLREYVSDEIDEILSSSYQLDRLFDKDTIIDYFLEGTSIEEIAREMIDNYDEYEEVLDIESEIMFESKYGQTYYYAYVNN
ncbi:hypothetical protein [Clostridium paraputrificum]|uniref:hypothetical protein n=1 Tax=Clostridium paraputrificum TaxID=29363 RepID=UPI00232E8AFC|nr:hypothetical protein [Clostridium paraputrificum]MDB2107884.1 hypothetical protein [Clostridium paraputrificum]MDB2114818.1 hypothetical protein [Clostridium paraputrificum]